MGEVGLSAASLASMGASIVDAMGPSLSSAVSLMEAMKPSFDAMASVESLISDSLASMLPSGTAGGDSWAALFDETSMGLGLSGVLGRPVLHGENASEATPDEFDALVSAVWLEPARSSRHRCTDQPASDDVLVFADEAGRPTRPLSCGIALVVGSLAWTVDLLWNGTPSPVSAFLTMAATYGGLRRARLIRS